MAARRSRNIIGLILSLLLLLLLIVGVVMTIRAVRDNRDKIVDFFSTDFKIELDGVVYRANSENSISLPRGQVKFIVDNSSNYNVTVVPVAENDFVYKVDGVEHSFSAEQNLTPAFSITLYQSAFVIDTTKDMSLYAVLSQLWGSNMIEIPVDVPRSPYKLVVTSDRAESIAFVFGPIPTGLELTPSDIVF